MSELPIAPHPETEEERLSRRADEALAAVAKVWPELLDTSGVDATLQDLMLSRTVWERLESAQQFQEAREWLRSLPRGEPSEHD